MKYVHTNIITKDWKRLADFYISVFNCEIVPPLRKQSGKWLSEGTGVQNASLEGAHLRLPGYVTHAPTLEIYQYSEVFDQPDIEPNHRGFGHIAFEVDNVEEVVQSIIAHGGTTNGILTRRDVDGVGTITFIYVRDPDGNLIELQNWS